jgi:hypothetical protein
LRYGRPSLIRSGARRGANRQVCGHRVSDGLKAFAGLLAKVEFRSMLPGFRFLFAAIAISMSILIFGLGATALMRAAHEDFATNTSWRAPPEPRFAQLDEATRPPVLAVLSVQPASNDPAVAPSPADAPVATPTDPATAPPSPEPQTTASLTPAESSTTEAVKPQTAAEATPLEPSIQTDVAAQSTPAPPLAETQSDAPASTAEPKIAVTDDSKGGATASVTTGRVSPTASAPTASAPQTSPTPPQADAQAMPDSSPAVTRIATLGGPPVPIEDSAAKAAENAREANAKLEKEKKLRAERAKELRRIAARRARLAQQQAAAQEAANPFAPHPLVGTPPTPASAPASAR